MGEETNNLFDSMKRQFIDEAIEVGFTKEQAEFLREKFGTTAIGFGVGLI